MKLDFPKDLLRQQQINEMIVTGNVEINKNRKHQKQRRRRKKLIRHFDYKCGNFCLFDAFYFHDLV